MSIKVSVIIPAFNEEASIGLVIRDIPEDLVDEIIVVDNGSTDQTANIARKAGATVVQELNPGYGSACMKGIDYLKSDAKESTDIVVFMDGDYADHPEELANILSPIINDQIEMVVGSRSLGIREPGSMTFPQIFGNWLATFLLNLFYGTNITDLGPFRAIKYECLMRLNMTDKNYGWTVEMQLKAAKHKLSYCEVPVPYRRRIGFSKVSGTFRGSISAGYKILWTIFKYL